MMDDGRLSCMHTYSVMRINLNRKNEGEEAAEREPVF
jgi:hypothetical protein